VLLCPLAILGCAATRQAVPSQTRAPLRIGVVADNPPIAFRQGGQLAGVEIDLGRRLAADLGSDARFIELPFDQLIPALLNRRIDVVMSGMTVTRAREFRVAFADPYLRTGLVAMMRRQDAPRYDSAPKVIGTSARVGVIEGTTGERFVRERLEQATIAIYRDSKAAVWELGQRYIDLYVNDMPQVAWYVAGHEGELAGMWTPLTDDALAWAFRPDDAELREAANVALARWRADGTLTSTLRRWLPGWPGPL